METCAWAQTISLWDPTSAIDRSRPGISTAPTVGGDSVMTVVAGAIVGLGAAWLLVRFVRSQLYALEPTDPLAFAAATLLLLSIAAAAAYLPAWRASRINPVIALRQE